MLKVQQDTLNDKARRIKEKFLKEYEKLMNEKNEEIQISRDHFKREQMENNRLNSEIERLTKLLTEADEELARKEDQIKEQEAIEVVEEKLHHEEERNQILRDRIESLEDERVREKGDLMRTEAELELLTSDTEELIALLQSLALGREPNINLLLGLDKREKLDSMKSLRGKKNLGKEEATSSVSQKTIVLAIEEIRSKVSSVRTLIADKYTEKYASECNVQ